MTPPRYSTNSAKIVTLRACAAGLAMAAVVNVWITYSEYIVHASRMNISQFPLALFALFVALVVGNAALGALWPGAALERGELLLVLSMGCVAAVVPTAGVAGFLMGVVASPYYFASPENKWDEVMLPYMPSWIAPTNDGNVMTWFFEGLPPGETVPWEVWVVPLGWWLLFTAALAFVCACLMVILRKQWIEHERLVFPLLAPVLDMTQTGGRRGPAFLRNRTFWLGFSLPFVIIAWNVICNFNTQLPRIPVAGRYLTILRDFPRVDTRINFFTLGFAYFANVDVLFSIWFFHIVYILQRGLMTRFGYTMPGRDSFCSMDAVSSWEGFGALTFMVLWGLWMARGHLAAVVRKALGAADAADDSDEMLSYRTAVFGLVLGTAYIVLWLHQAGMDWRVLCLYVFGTFVICVGMARVVSQVGLLYVREPLSAQVFSMYVVGSMSIAPKSMTALAMSFSLITLGRGLFLPSLAKVTKLTDAVMALIERDAALAGELLVRARTASIGPGKPLLDLPKAIRRMGPRRLIHWLLELSQSEVFRSKLLHNLMKEQYLHNFAVACASSYLFRVQGLDTKKGFLCGLLHDIGHHAVLSGLAALGRTEAELLTPAGVRQAMTMHHGAEVARYHDRPDRAKLFKPVVNAVAVANAADKIKAADVRERTAMLMRVKLCYNIGLGKPEIRELARVVEKARTERYLNALVNQR